MIHPYRRRPTHKTISLVSRSGLTLLDEHGRRRRLSLPLEHDRVYARELTATDQVRNGHGALLCWNGQPIRWLLDPARPAHGQVIVLDDRLPLPKSDAELLGELGRFRDWLTSVGAAPQRSFGATGMSLLRSTLRRPLWTSFGELPPISFTLGGRQQDGGPRPARYEGSLVHSDIRAAYASLLGRVRYGAPWTRADWHPSFAGLADREGVLLYARARVRIPGELQWWAGPLPRRPQSGSGGVAFEQFIFGQSYPVGRTIQGTWTWQELAEAEASGARILRVFECWAQWTPDQPFGPWWEQVERGRQLGGTAGLFAKIAGNATWGQLAISKGERALWRKGRRGQLELVPLPALKGNPSAKAYDLAEWICGVTRARLHEGMRLAGGRFVSAHTDGLWARGFRVPGWRVTEQASELEAFAPQCLRFRAEGGRWRYTVAGVPSGEAAGWFRSMWKGALERREIVAL